MNAPIQHPAKPRRRRATRWWFTFFICAVGVGTLGASAAVGLVLGYVNSLPPIERLEDYNPSEISLVYDREGTRLIGEFADERRQVVPIGEMPDMLKRAFLAIEDERFKEHFGVDWWSVGRTVVANYKSGSSAQGASTITMQLPRNVIPEKVSRQKKFERKLREMFMAFQIERRYSKDQILEFYMNHIAMGRQSFGVQAAADTYFGKTLNELTLAECASLAAIPKGPSLYNPLGNPKRNLTRRNQVLRRMRDLKWIGEEQYDRAVGAPLTLNPGKRRANVANSEFPYFVDGLHRDLTTYYEVEPSDIREGGWSIRSTINPRWQQIVESELRDGLVQVERLWNDVKNKERAYIENKDYAGGWAKNQSRVMKIEEQLTSRSFRVERDGYRGVVNYPARLPFWEPKNILKKGSWLDVKVTSVNYGRREVALAPLDTNPIQGSATVLDARTGEVLAVSGGADFRDSGSNGQFNRAVMGGKQAGSTVKPFFFAMGLERGLKPHDIIMDTPVSFPAWPQPYRPRNYEKVNFGPTTIIESLEHSRNVPTVRLFNYLGVKRVLPQICRFDFRPGDFSWSQKFRPELPVCLGTVDMTTLELAAAYQVFTNHGVGRHPSFFQGITDREGRTVLSPREDETPVIDPVHAFQMAYILRQAVVDGTGKLAIGSKFPSPPFPPISGKTGTTDDGTDALFAGFTPDIVLVVYVGFDTPRSMGPKMTGGRVAGPIWAGIFGKIHATREDWKMKFDPPPGLEYADICSETGKRSSGVCERYGHKVYFAVPYKRGEAPRERCEGGYRPPIIGGGGSLASSSEASPRPDAPKIDTSILSELGSGTSAPAAPPPAPPPSAPDGAAAAPGI